MFKKYDTIKLALSDDWSEMLLQAVESNSRITSELHLTEKAELIKRNDRILDKLKKYTREDGTVYLFKNEAEDIIWILLENFTYLDDFRSNAMDIIKNTADKINELSQIKQNK